MKLQRIKSRKKINVTATKHFLGNYFKTCISLDGRYYLEQSAVRNAGNKIAFIFPHSLLSTREQFSYTSENDKFFLLNILNVRILVVECEQ